MKNRDRYILKVNEYDLLMNILQNIRHGSPCPINAVSGKNDYSRCYKYSCQCWECCQAWLNEEE